MAFLVIFTMVFWSLMLIFGLGVVGSDFIFKDFGGESSLGWFIFFMVYFLMIFRQRACRFPA
jgi:hypothetical protein